MYVTSKVKKEKKTYIYKKERKKEKNEKYKKEKIYIFVRKVNSPVL